LDCDGTVVVADFKELVKGGEYVFKGDGEGCAGVVGRGQTMERLGLVVGGGGGGGSYYVDAREEEEEEEEGGVELTRVVVG
jgi:hypothetical protein